jgi:site-specific recombinase XerD
VNTNNLGNALQAFFMEYLPKQRALSPHTRQSYRDSLKLLLVHVAGKSGDPSGLDLADSFILTASDIQPRFICSVRELI